MVWVALFTAITCILAPLSIPIPISPVPITLTNLVLFISLYILSWKEALISYILYLLLGICGLPVFSGFSGGIGKLAGPTGGYLAGFIFLILICIVCLIGVLIYPYLLNGSTSSVSNHVPEKMSLCFHFFVSLYGYFTKYLSYFSVELAEFK